jgi:hypothetical protein
MKISSFKEDFGKNTIKWEAFRNDIKAAMKVVCDKYDVNAIVGHASYSSQKSEFKLTFAVKDLLGQAIDLEAEEFKLYAKRYGMTPEDLDVKFFYTGDIFKIKGMTKTKSKYCIIVKNLSKNSELRMTIITAKQLVDKAKLLGTNLTSSDKMAKLDKTGIFDE